MTRGSTVQGNDGPKASQAIAQASKKPPVQLVDSDIDDEDVSSVIASDKSPPTRAVWRTPHRVAKSANPRALKVDGDDDDNDLSSSGIASHESSPLQARAAR